MDSILTSIKKLLGIPEEYNHFDTDIIIHINSVFMTLQQLGVGPESGFNISDASATWDQFFGENSRNLEAVKSYIYFKIRLAFDPPQSSAHMEAIKEQINDLEWRLNVQVENETFEAEKKGGSEDATFTSHAGYRSALRNRS